MKTRIRHFARCCATLAAAMFLLLPSCTDDLEWSSAATDREIGMTAVTGAATKGAVSALLADTDVRFISHDITLP